MFEQKVREADIEIIGAIDADAGIDKTDIIRVLQQVEINLEHGGEFTGRPSTRIFHDSRYLVKLHMDLQFHDNDARPWVLKKLHGERAYRLYHPCKTWFLLKLDGHRHIANISPYMMPLHQAHIVYSAEDMLAYLEQGFDYSIRVLKEFDKQLDGGLSNFAIDKQHRLYYVDDDFYSGHQFSGFCNIIGVYLRGIDWLDRTAWSKLGQTCKNLIIKYFEDEHWLFVVSEQIKDLFMANKEQKERRDAFLQGLIHVPPTAHMLRVSVSETEKVTLEKADNIALLADIHANYGALRKLVDELEKHHVSKVVVLGDIVGYGPQPNECIELLRELGWTVIKGNHDHALLTDNPAVGFSSTGRWVIEWSRGVIKEDNKRWLDTLLPFIKTKNALFVHGSPLDKTFFNAYVYRMTYEDNLNNMQQRNLAMCFHGHSHVQGVYYRQKNKDGFSDSNSIQLGDFCHSLICPGSVGQPRSNKPGAEFAIFERQQNSLQFYRLEYDMAATIDLMKKYRFPESLYKRLELGQ